MAEPSKKSADMTEFLDRLFNRTELIKADTCVLCGKPAVEFKNELSRKEFTISGACQSCQDKLFG